MNAVKDFLGLGDSTTTAATPATNSMSQNVGARNSMARAPATITRPMSAVGNLKNKAMGSLNSTRKANNAVAANAMLAEEATGQMGGRRRVKRGRKASRKAGRKAGRKASRKVKRSRRGSRRH